MDLLPDAEVTSLLTLLLQESQPEVRPSPAGNLILLEDPDRSR